MSTANSRAGPTPASHSLLTGCRAIMPYNTSTTLGGIMSPSELPAWITPETMRLS